MTHCFFDVSFSLLVLLFVPSLSEDLIGEKLRKVSIRGMVWFTFTNTTPGTWKAITALWNTNKMTKCWRILSMCIFQLLDKQNVFVCDTKRYLQVRIYAPVQKKPNWMLTNWTWILCKLENFVLHVWTLHFPFCFAKIIIWLWRS